MQTKTKVMAALLLLNVCLFGVGLYFVGNMFKELAAIAHPNAAPADFRMRLKASRIASSSLHPTQNVTSAPPTVTYITNQFHWREIESPDYRQYIANLRGIGCPEATIKDIIITDIMRLYAAQRGQLYHNGREFKFWETNEKRKLTARQWAERESQLAQIDKQIPAVLRELLGINYERELNKYFVDNNEDEQRLSFISEDKRSRIVDLRDEIEGLRERILDEANGGPLTSAQREELANIEAKRRGSLAEILTPAELEDFELRTSPTAERLRDELIGFNPTEEEFRQIYSRQKALDDKYAFAAADEPAVKQAKTEEQAKIDEELRTSLGEGRYAELSRARNPDYREACLFAELYELPSSTASSILEIKQIAEREKRNLLATANLAEETRLAALQAIRVETEKSLRQILGTKGLSNYTQTSGKWVEGLGAAN